MSADNVSVAAALSLVSVWLMRETRDGSLVSAGMAERAQG
jgi:hypothetical protein